VEFVVQLIDLPFRPFESFSTSGSDCINPSPPAADVFQL
jgi:hypothetical protein